MIRKWDIATTDISKAFLQGITYEELASLTGEPLREVNFYLPGYCLPFLRKIKGWEDFDPLKEVIHCDKPGTGCVDAPRCFSLKLAKVTKELCGMSQCTIDNELCFLHRECRSSDGSANASAKTYQLIAVLAKHVDDLKITASKENIIWILKKIEQVFGQLKIEWNNFTNCGVRHRQDVNTKEVTMDQAEYINGVKTLSSSEMQRTGPETLCSTLLHHQYWSVLGAIAFATLTRPDILVFVSALQRFSHAPKIIHCKRLNTVIRWAKRNPKCLRFAQLDTANRPAGTMIQTHLRMYADAAFKKEDDSGHSMRGALYVRCIGKKIADFQGTRKGHLVDYVGAKQRRVVRATFSAELLNACDTQDKGLLLSQQFHEMCTGQTHASCARELRERGGHEVPMVLYIDALSVFAATTATFVKTPAENGVLCHLLFLRELLDHNVLHAFVWCDTRDMLADGLTKGAVDRAAIHAVMNGTCELVKVCKVWRPAHLLRNQQ